jgi:VIT1/CCC1 family predicted Fe2+/Mn2+ transporter/rubrerythrin
MSQTPENATGVQPGLVAALQRNWRTEMQGAATYRYLAEHEADPRKSAILMQLADGEARHAERWAERLRALGVAVPPEAPPKAGWITQHSPLDASLRRLEREEEEHIKIYEEQANRYNDEPSREIIRDAVRDEAMHANVLREMTAATGGIAAEAQRRLDMILKRERWHTRTGSWFGDAIYGANDGLGAVFGMVAGVAGASNDSSHFVLIAGLAGALASALSMGSGAYLATKSEGEVHHAEMAKERNEVMEHPDEEMEELELFYQLKGLSAEESKSLVGRLANDPEQLAAALYQEELGISEEKMPNPVMSAVSASISTLLGALIPVIPFFFLNGITAVIVAACVSLIAHFAVGASKTFVTGRSWIASGAEMTIVGAIEGAITYGIGAAVAPYAGGLG